MRAVFVLCCFVLSAAAQVPQSTPPQPPGSPASLAQLNFLLGTWSARTVPVKGAPAQILGEYTFRTDLLKNVVTRVSTTDNCESAKALDCQHYDALTIYRDPADPVLHALYLDSQGHTIHYNLSFPDPTTVIFFSTSPGPQTRLVYHVQKNIITGKLQTAPAGSTNFVSTLDWFGVRMTQNNPTAGQTPATTHALDSLQDTTRILFVFASQSDLPQFRQQLTLLAHHDAEFADRNLILIPVLTTWTPVDKQLYDRNLPFTTVQEQIYARTHFKVAPNSFTVLLVGKDGEEKLRSHAPVTPDKLFSIIDAMPMRRQEMQKR